MKRVKARLKKSRIGNEKGLALLETIPILVVFIIILAYGLGFFGVIHTGILNSISARAYAFETFRNRANLVYFRDRITDVPNHFAYKGSRFHGIKSEVQAGDTDLIYATKRELAMGREQPDVGTSEGDHNTKIPFTAEPRFRKGVAESSPAWIMVGYGICIDAGCGD